MCVGGWVSKRAWYLDILVVQRWLNYPETVTVLCLAVWMLRILQIPDLDYCSSARVCDLQDEDP